MWIMLSDAFLSIVAAEYPDELLVRARAKGDIERVFPRAKVVYTPRGDYHYRANVNRQVVIDEITVEIINIDYPNFKNSVAQKDRHLAYLRVWSVMMGFQEGRAPKKRVRRKAERK
jgi:hypothetical protein